MYICTPTYRLLFLNVKLEHRIHISFVLYLVNQASIISKYK